MTDYYDQYKRLTYREKSYLLTHPHHALAIQENTQKAYKETEILFGTNRRNDRSDAFRHCFWSALLSRDIGFANALKFTNAHESSPMNPKKEKEMDIYNNSVGLQIGRTVGSDFTIRTKCLTALQQGKLKTTPYSVLSTTEKGPANRKSGKHWFEWADKYAENSKSIEDLETGFKQNVKDFINALKDAGVKKENIKIITTWRHEKRAYLMHWAWMIAKKGIKPKNAEKRKDVDIIWDHGNDAKSREAAQAMVDAFGISSKPVLKSKHSKGDNETRRSEAIDMTFTWTGKITIKLGKYRKNKTEITKEVTYMDNVIKNTDLHDIGETYHVYKLLSSKNHWYKN